MKRVVLQGVAAALTCIGMMVLGTTAGASASARQPTAAQVTLLDQTTWSEPGGTFGVRVRVTAAPAGSSIRLVLHDQLTSRQAFEDSVAGTVSGDVTAMPAQPLALDATGAMSLSYPVGDGGLGLGRDDHGVYPVSVVIIDPGGTSQAELVTYLVLQPDPVYRADYPPLDVAILMDIGATPGLEPDGSIDLSEEELAAVVARVEVLDQTTTVPVTVAPVPETLEALGDRPATQPTLEGLTRAVQGRQVLALPYVNLDLDALADAGMLNEVQPQLDAGAQTARSRLGVGPLGGIWLAGPTADGALAPALQALAIPRTVVPRSAVASVPDLTDLAEAVTGPVALADGGPTALVADDDLASRLLGDEGRLDAQRFVAELAMIWALAPSHQRGVVVEIPALATLDPATVVEALTSLTEGPAVVRPVPLDAMFSVPPAGQSEQPPVIELASDGEASPALQELPDALRQAQAELSGLAAMLNDRRLIRSLHRSLWISIGRDTPDPQRMAYVHRVTRTEADLAAAINAPTTFRITLTARDGTIPLSIANTSNQTVRVRVHLASSQIEFPDGDVLDLDVPPGGERVDVDVQLRASGAFPLGVTITSPDGSVVLDRTSFTIRSTAISGVGLVLSIGAGLFLLIWWARHWRTARRSTRLVPEHPAHRATTTRTPVGQGTRASSRPGRPY